MLDQDSSDTAVIPEAPTFESKEEAAAHALATASWGWEFPPDEILALAERAIRTKGLQVGEILVQWDVIESETRDRLLKEKPNGVPSLDYFSKREPSRVLPYVQEVLALQDGTAFYDRLSLLQPHKALRDPAILKACKNIDAVLMLIDGKTPVLVFAEFEVATKFSQKGSAEREADPIIRSLDGRLPKIALGSRDQISIVQKNHESADGTGSSDHGQNLWDVRGADPDTPVHEKELARLFDHAMQAKATDVAFTPNRNGSVEVRLRRFGRLVEPFRNVRQSVAPEKDRRSTRQRDKTILPAEVAEKATRALLSRSGTGSFSDLREPKDGQINYQSSTSDAFFRLSFIPLNHPGELRRLTSISVRMFTRTETEILPEDLRFPSYMVDIVKDFVHMPQGLGLVSGPTNSGKSTTIAAIAGVHRQVHGDDLKRVSVEDPIERYVRGVTQISVPQHLVEEKRFEVILRALKRHDPDFLWNGEVRDRFSAMSCIDFALDGNLAVSTIHGRNSVAAFDNLLMKVPEDVRPHAADAMSHSIAQRLIKQVCPHCSERDLAPTDEEKHAYELNRKMTGEDVPALKTVTRVIRPEGCSECDRGYIGELPIFEILQFTSEVKEAALGRIFKEDTRKNRGIMLQAREMTLLKSGLLRMQEGETDLKSILFYS